MNIVFDIGGTNMRVAVVRDEEIEDVTKIQTPHESKDMIETLIAIALEKSAGEKIEAVVGGIPGVISDGTFVFQPPHLAHWIGTSFTPILEERLGARVRAANDMTLIGTGEANRGAGKGSRIMVYVTVSTGVNGVRVVDGVADPSTYGSEIGHQFTPDGELESLISGTAVRKKFGIEPKNLDSFDERNTLADYLAVGLYNSVLHWSPDTIVLGGSMITGVNPIPLERVEQSLRKRVRTIYPECPKIKMAELGDNGGLIGAAILASEFMRPAA